MKVKRYPHLSSSALVRTAILLPITLVPEFLTVFNATRNRIISQIVRMRRVEARVKKSL